jgi:hypothetical protein
VVWVTRRLELQKAEAPAPQGRAQARRLGRAFFLGSGIPIGRRAVTEAEYAEVRWLLEQVERLAAGQPPRER